VLPVTICSLVCLKKCFLFRSFNLFDHFCNLLADLHEVVCLIYTLQFKEIIFLFSEDTFILSKVTVKTFTLLPKMYNYITVSTKK